MKPSIQDLFDRLSRRLDDLESQLKKPESQLGHRAIFSNKRSGEVPIAPNPPSTTRYLREDGTWVLVEASGGGSTGSLNYQRFSYRATGSEGTSFLVNLSTVAGGEYTVVATLADSTGSFTFRVPSGSRTSSQFRMETAAALQANDRIDFLIFEDADAAGGGGGHTNVYLPHTEVGYNVSYSGSIPLSVMAFTYDPTLNVGVAGLTSSFLFRSTAAAGTGSATSYVRLYNLTDSVLVCTASFLGTTPTTKDVALYVGSTATQHMPSGARVYEVQIIASTSPSASIEFYSAGVRCTTKLI